MQNRPLKTNLLCKHLLIWHHSIGRTALQLWEFDLFLGAFCAGSSSKSNAINQYLLLWVPQCRIGSLAFPISLVKVKLITLNSLASFFIFFIFNIVLALNSSKRGGCVLKKQRHAAREVEWDSTMGKSYFTTKISPGLLNQAALSILKNETNLCWRRKAFCASSEKHTKLCFSLSRTIDQSQQWYRCFFYIPCVSLCAA